jgi:hypothetical protein
MERGRRPEPRAAPRKPAEPSRDGGDVGERIYDALHDDERAALGELQRDPDRRQTCASYLARTTA